MEILLLTALARAPMHGYELKLELAYKHVEWWAKCEHGHVYAALTRLEKGKFIKEVTRKGGRANQRVFGITAAGKRRLEAALVALGAQPDSTYFDVDMFLSSCHVLERERAIAILVKRRDAVSDRHVEATALARAMEPHVPAVGRLIMDHRVDYLAREIVFLERALVTLRAETKWGAFLDESIGEFVERTRVPLERD
jgi:DNA-binding PadR family transcriptional regulator